MWSSRVETNFRRIRTKRMSAYEAPFDLAALSATSASSFMERPPGRWSGGSSGYTATRRAMFQTTETEPAPDPRPKCKLFLAACDIREHVPLLGRDPVEVVELTGAAQPLAAVDDDALAVDVGDAVRDEKDGEVGELGVVADAPHRDAFDERLGQLLRGQQPLPRALCREGTGGDGVDADPVARPLDGERTGEREHARLGRRRGDDETRARL